MRINHNRSSAIFANRVQAGFARMDKSLKSLHRMSERIQPDGDDASGLAESEKMAHPDQRALFQVKRIPERAFFY